MAGPGFGSPQLRTRIYPFVRATGHALEIQKNGDSTSRVLARATAPETSSLSIPPAMLLFAHPDDEVLALGARLSRFGSAHLLHATDGAPRNKEDSRAHGFSSLADYRQARLQELQDALDRAGIGNAHRESLGFPDQEACLRLQDLTHAVYERLRTLQPEVVFTHPYEGGHPDHDACAFAVHTAIKFLAAERAVTPMIIEGTFYHAGPQGMGTGEFLQEPHATKPLAYTLSQAESEKKRALLACFTTQQATLQYFPLDRELFRIAPKYDFSAPPHIGQVFYDRYDWGMQSDRFCTLAAETTAAFASEHSLA